ncbi:PEGA domain-containing protein [bacterium]|nr:PEGA domain-containing protein [bacterium]
MKKLLMLALLLSAVAILGAGCIRSRVVIHSEPEGAEVIWRGKPYGATPVTIPFIWYWHYDYSIEKPGYKRINIDDDYFRTPPWFLMPTDLIMELIPIPIPDTRTRTYVLEPLQPKEAVPIQ